MSSSYRYISKSILTRMEHEVGHDVELEKLLEDPLSERREEEQSQPERKLAEGFVRGHEDSGDVGTLQLMLLMIPSDV